MTVRYKYKRIQLTRSETTVYTFDVAPWEVPILAAVNGGDRIQEVGETPVNFDAPDAASEFVRLATKYKVDPASGQDFVEVVYGSGERGVRALAEEIRRALDNAAAPPVQSLEYDAKDDPLLGLFDTPPEDGGAVGIEE